MKHIVKEGLNGAKSFTNEDFLVLLSGSNDFYHNSPSQLTIIQALESLLSLNQHTNVIIYSIPYRYDDHSFNNRIFYANMAIDRIVKEYKGSLNLMYIDNNYELKRSHFTKHGLHYNRRGKQLIGERTVNLVRNWNYKSTLKQSVAKLQVSVSAERRKSPLRIPRSDPPCLNTSSIEAFPDLSPDTDVAAAADVPECSVAAMSLDPPTLCYASCASLTDFPPLPPTSAPSSKLGSFLVQHPGPDLNKTFC